MRGRPGVTRAASISFSLRAKVSDWCAHDTTFDVTRVGSVGLTHPRLNHVIGTFLLFDPRLTPRGRFLSFFLLPYFLAFLYGYKYSPLFKQTSRMFFFQITGQIGGGTNNTGTDE